MKASRTSPTLSAFIICMNEERQIRRALQSISWCDEIIVVDSGSTDKTLEICKEFTSKVISRPWPGHRAQKQFALEQCTHDWVLNIDADEEITPELKNEIIETLSSSLPYDGYELLRVVHYLGEFWRKGGWYPEYRLRLLKKSKASWGGEDPHEKAVVSGRTKRLTKELHHYTYESIFGQIRSLNSLTNSAAMSLVVKGARPTIIDILGRPLVRFFKFYLIKRGYREGVRGLYVAVLDAVGVFLKYVKVWEILTFEKSKTSEGKER